MSEVCMKCYKQLGFMKYKSESGLLCKTCKFEEIDNKPTPSMTGLRVGLAIVSVIAFVGLMWGLFS